MLSPAEYREYASNARKTGLELRVEAVTAIEPRKSLLLKWANEREEHADFYEDRALINEDYERRHAPKQEKAA